jgi:N-acetylmuramoyl-L-alanine amidase
VILGGTASVPKKIFLVLTGQAAALLHEGKVIVVDSGYGGTDSGAVHNGYYEKNLNLQFAKKFENDLGQLGAKVLYTNHLYIQESILQRFMVPLVKEMRTFT